MKKTIFTEVDIEDLARRGETSLSLSENVLLTDLAYETAHRLGVKLVAEAALSPANPTQANLTGDIRHELLAINNELFAAGLITSTGGNISVRVPGKNNECWITPGSIFKGNLRPEMMVRIDLDGNSLDANAYPASSERFVHCEIYKRRPEVNAIVHSHGDWATLLILSGREFFPISEDSAFVGKVINVPFIEPGTKELAKAVADAFLQSDAALMQNHGLVTAGKNLRAAADLTHIIEHTAKRILLCNLLGKEPPAIPEHLIPEYQKLWAKRS
jgi:L-ribulose-5-phosphate 4-epimerase